MVYVLTLLYELQCLYVPKSTPAEVVHDALHVYATSPISTLGLLST